MSLLGCVALGRPGLPGPAALMPSHGLNRSRLCPRCSVSSLLRADEVIGIDLGTTNSCVAVMEGKVGLLRPKLNSLGHVDSHVDLPQPTCVIYISLLQSRLQSSWGLGVRIHAPHACAAPPCLLYACAAPPCLLYAYAAPPCLLYACAAPPCLLHACAAPPCLLHACTRPRVASHMHAPLLFLVIRVLVKKGKPLNPQTLNSVLR